MLSMRGSTTFPRPLPLQAVSHQPQRRTRLRPRPEISVYYTISTRRNYSRIAPQLKPQGCQDPNDPESCHNFAWCDGYKRHTYELDLVTYRTHLWGLYDFDLSVILRKRIFSPEALNIGISKFMAIGPISFRVFSGACMVKV